MTRAILGREELGSTGIGQGVAVPHTRHPTRQPPDRHGRPVAARGRFRGPGRRAGRYLLPAGLAAEPAWRPPPGSGEYLATSEGRAIRQFPASGQDAGERDRGARGSRPGLALDRSRHHARPRQADGRRSGCSRADIVPAISAQRRRASGLRRRRDARPWRSGPHRVAEAVNGNINETNGPRPSVLWSATRGLSCPGRSSRR